MAAANEATKNIKFNGRKTSNKMQQSTKKVASIEGRWDGTRERQGAQGGRDSIILGANELKGGGELKSINLLNYIISQPI